MAVPPMPAPKMPIASPRRSGGNHALTKGTPTANAVPPMPRKNPPTSSSGVGVDGHEPDEEHRHDRGRGDEREHHPAAVPVGQRADDDPAERPDEHGDRDQERHVGLGQLAQRPGLAEHRAERADQGPRPEVDGEAQRRQDQHQHGTTRGGGGPGRGLCVVPCRHAAPPGAPWAARPARPRVHHRAPGRCGRRAFRPDPAGSATRRVGRAEVAGVVPVDAQGGPGRRLLHVRHARAPGGPAVRRGVRRSRRPRRAGRGSRAARHRAGCSGRRAPRRRRAPPPRRRPGRRGRRTRRTPWSGRRR